MAMRALRLTVLCAGATRLTRAAAFPDPDEPLDAGGRAKAAAVRLAAPPRCWIAPARAAKETATLLGVAGPVEPALADRAAGTWAGRGLDGVPADELAAWLTDPSAAVPGGEEMTAVTVRAGAWLDSLAGLDGAALAVTHPDTVRGLLAHALGLPLAATLAIDLAPLRLVRLSYAGRWRLVELRSA